MKILDLGSFNTPENLEEDIQEVEEDEIEQDFDAEIKANKEN